MRFLVGFLAMTALWVPPFAAIAIVQREPGLVALLVGSTALTAALIWLFRELDDSDSRVWDTWPVVGSVWRDRRGNERYQRKWEAKRDGTDSQTG